MASKQDDTVEETCKDLVRIVARTFYNDELIVVLDNIVRAKWITSKDLVSALRLPPKQVNKYLNELYMSERVITAYCSHCRSEPKNCSCGKKSKGKRPNFKLGVTADKNEEEEEQGRLNFWYVDYNAFYNVIKTRLIKIEERLQKREEERRNATTYIFICPKCSTRYTASTASYGGQDMLPICGDCDMNLKEILNSGTNEQISLQNKMRSQCGRVYDLLDDLESSNLETNHPDSSAEFQAKFALQRRRRENDVTTSSGRTRIMQSLAHADRIEVVFSDEEHDLETGKVIKSKRKGKRKRGGGVSRSSEKGKKTDVELQNNEDEIVPWFLRKSFVTNDLDYLVMKGLVTSRKERNNDRHNSSSKLESSEKMNKEHGAYCEKYYKADKEMFPSIPEYVRIVQTKGWRILGEQ
eukprot:g6671.t1